MLLESKVNKVIKFLKVTLELAVGGSQITARRYKNDLLKADTYNLRLSTYA